jgi:hypothetical protein
MSTIETRIPARLDRLPWSRFHWRVLIGLGTVWILDGLEVTIVGSVAARLSESGSGIAVTPADIGTAAAFYVVGACLGALFFGQLTDRFGRKRLFIITLAVYVVATVATAFAFSPWYFFLARFVTGAGIGGEYAAINSAIDELIPARLRGRIDLVINGTYWAGAAAGAGLAVFLLDTSIFPAERRWRCRAGAVRPTHRHRRPRAGRDRVRRVGGGDGCRRGRGAPVRCARRADSVGGHRETSYRTGVIRPPRVLLPHISASRAGRSAPRPRSGLARLTPQFGITIGKPGEARPSISLAAVAAPRFTDVRWASVKRGLPDPRTRARRPPGRIPSGR